MSEFTAVPSQRGQALLNYLNIDLLHEFRNVLIHPE